MKHPRGEGLCVILKFISIFVLGMECVKMKAE